MDIKDKKKESGFTLIEFLLYSAILTIVISTITFIGLNALENRARFLAIEEVNKNARYSLQAITHFIRIAEEVSSIGVSSLTLDMGESEDHPVIIYLVEEDDQIMVSRGGEVTGPLTTEVVEVIDLNFDEISSGLVEIVIEMRYKNPADRSEFDLQRTFRTKENIRN